MTTERKNNMIEENPLGDVQYDPKIGLYVPLRKLCLLESTAAVLCDDVLNSNLILSLNERERLQDIQRDEARHYKLAKTALESLQKVDHNQLSNDLIEYHEEHRSRWQGSIGRIARLHGDERLVMHYMDLFEKTILGVIPEEGKAFVDAVKNDEPKHYAWGRDVLTRLVNEGVADARFVKEQMSPKNWPAEEIMRRFRDVQRHIGIK